MEQKLKKKEQKGTKTSPKLHPEVVDPRFSPFKRRFSPSYLF
jgi:hypothetical protein